MTRECWNYGYLCGEYWPLWASLTAPTTTASEISTERSEMTIHTIHPDSHEHGLADGCPRCAEHAENPVVSLDASNLRELVRRAVDRSNGSRSETEAVAVANVLTTLERAGKLAEVAPHLVVAYLRDRWRVPVSLTTEIPEEER